MGGVIAAFGSLAILGMEKNSEERQNKRVTFMVLFVDFYALALALTILAVS